MKKKGQAEWAKNIERGSQRGRKMLASTFRKQATRSRTCRAGIVQVCFQHNINFPFIKSPCGALLSLQLYRHPVEGLWGPWGEGPCGLRSPGLSTLPAEQDNTPDSYTVLPLNLSAASTHHSKGMSYCRRDQSRDEAVWAKVCSRVWVCVSNRKKIKQFIKLTKASLYNTTVHHPSYNISTPKHMSTCQRLFRSTHQYFSHGCTP